MINIHNCLYHYVSIDEYTIALEYPLNDSHQKLNIFMMLNILNSTKALKYLSTVKKNPYEILGIKPSSNLDQIKKAYRIIAQKYHPDKNPDPKAQQHFVDAKQAYETLSDEDKRRQYDNENSNKWGNSRNYGFDKDPFEQFNQDIYKDKSRVYHETYTTGSRRRRRGEDISKQVNIKFLDAVKGSHISLQYERKDTCKTCNGNRCAPGTAPTRCLSCGGSGSTIFRQSSIVMHLQCTRCKGIGLIIKNPCTDCRATGIKIQKVVQNIEIPPGIQNGQSISLKQKGNQSQNGPSGDLIVKFNIQKHPKFRKNGYNIESTEWLTISQAALGCKKVVNTIWGSKQIKIPSGSQDGKKLIISGEGIKKSLEKGDHIFIMRIKIPTNLTPRQKQIFEELSKEQSSINNDSHTDYQEQQQQHQQSVGEELKPNAFNKFKDYFK